MIGDGAVDIDDAARGKSENALTRRICFDYILFFVQLYFWERYFLHSTLLVSFPVETPVDRFSLLRIESNEVLLRRQLYLRGWHLLKRVLSFQIIDTDTLSVDSNRIASHNQKSSNKRSDHFHRLTYFQLLNFFTIKVNLNLVTNSHHQFVLTPNHQRILTS